MREKTLHAVSSILLAVIVPLASHASDAFIETQTATFESFHDPGYLVITTSSGETLQLWFHYQLITYESVSTWKAGETMKIGIDPERGTGIMRESDGTFYKVFFPKGDDPIDTVEDRCLEGSDSTMGIAQCYATTAEFLDLDISYLIMDLGSRRDLQEEADAFAESMKTARRNYARLFSADWDQRGGSIGAINQWTTVLRLIYAERTTLEGLY